MPKISVSDVFKKFIDNIKIDQGDIDSISSRYHSITRRINYDYWNSSSDFLHSLYVGSYGRGTCIFTSDIDVVVELPWSEYERFNKYSGNKQSALLASLRDTLKKTYSTSHISADGQVVVIAFSDGIVFEIVPAFKYTDGSYCYPDTNDGGSWRKMDPRSEMYMMNSRNNSTNGNLKNLCRMARAWNSSNSVCMKGALIDVTAYRFIENYQYSDKSYLYYDYLSRDYFKFLYENADQEYWVMPGSGSHIYKKYSFKREAKEAYEHALKAIECESKDYVYTWHSEWREIYGTKFPGV